MKLFTTPMTSPWVMGGASRIHKCGQLPFPIANGVVEFVPDNCPRRDNLRPRRCSSSMVTRASPVRGRARVLVGIELGNVNIDETNGWILKRGF